MLLRISRHLRIQDIGQDLGCEIDHRHADPSGMQVFRRLQADKPGADHDRFLHAVLLRVCADTLRIVRRPHLKYTGQLFPRDRELRC